MNFRIVFATLTMMVLSVAAQAERSECNAADFAYFSVETKCVVHDKEEDKCKVAQLSGIDDSAKMVEKLRRECLNVGSAKVVQKELSEIKEDLMAHRHFAYWSYRRGPNNPDFDSSARGTYTDAQEELTSDLSIYFSPLLSKK